MIAWFFGVFLIGSGFIVATWSKQGWDHRHPFSRWNAVLVAAVGVNLLATGIAFATASRLIDVYHGIAFPTVVPAPLLASYWVIFLGNTMLVWVGAMRKGRTYSKPIIWGYWASLALWTGVMAI